MIFFFAEKPDVEIRAVIKCIEHLRTMKDFTPGRTEELEDGVRCVTSAYDAVEERQALWEAHRRYVDIHCMIHGEERVSVCSLADAEVGVYHADRDYLETKGVPMVDLQATAGTVLCLFPNDVHRTRVQTCTGKESRILKVIFKVPIELINP